MRFSTGPERGKRIPPENGHDTPGSIVIFPANDGGEGVARALGPRSSHDGDLGLKTSPVDCEEPH